MKYPAPQYSKNQVRKAGRFLADNSIGDVRRSPDRNRIQQWIISSAILENWRAAHGAVLNTAQAWIRMFGRDAERAAPSRIVAQRLKRWETIVDKLHQGRAVDLATMHDIAGIRVISENLNDMLDFRDRLLESRARHRHMHNPTKFNYVAAPKTTGYRGIHDVYQRQSGTGQEFNGLRFEVQHRTLVQHAWATAVEVYDSTQFTRFKFENTENPAYDQFRIVSELFARVHEGTTSCLPELSDQRLRDKYVELEATTHAIGAMRGLRVVQQHAEFRENMILQITQEGSLYIHQFRSLPDAIDALAEIEKSEETENAVLVGGKAPAHIRNAFRNYFSDTTDFIALLDRALQEVG